MANALAHDMNNENMPQELAAHRTLSPQHAQLRQKFDARLNHAMAPQASFAHKPTNKYSALNTRKPVAAPDVAPKQMLFAVSNLRINGEHNALIPHQNNYGGLRSGHTDTPIPMTEITVAGSELRASGAVGTYKNRVNYQASTQRVAVQGDQLKGVAVLTPDPATQNQLTNTNAQKPAAKKQPQPIVGKQPAQKWNAQAFRTRANKFAGISGPGFGFAGAF